VASSVISIAAYSSYDHVDLISPRPLLTIAGTNADTLYFSEQAIAKAAEPKELSSSREQPTSPTHRWARRSTPITADELSRVPLVSREQGLGTRESLIAALRRSLGDSPHLAPPAIELSSATAMRAAVLAGGGPAVMSRLSVADDLALNRLREVPVQNLNLRRDLRAIWVGACTPPAGAVRDLLSHIARQRPMGERMVRAAALPGV